MSTNAIVIAAGVLAVLSRIKSIVVWCVDKWRGISPVLAPVIAQVESAALDGVITKDERKRLAWTCVSLLEERNAIRLNWLTRKIVNILIDRIAGRLPDYKASQEARQLIADAKTIILK